MLMRTTTASPDADCTHHGRGCHRKGVGFSSSAFFANVYTHISDPSVFSVPSYCKKTDTEGFRDDHRPLPTILERFIVL